MKGRREASDADIRAFIDAAPAELPYSALARQIIDRFGADRAWSVRDLVAYCRAKRTGRPWNRSKFDADAELRSFVDDRLWRQSLDDIVAGCRATLGRSRTPSRSALHRYSRARSRQLGL